MFDYSSRLENCGQAIALTWGSQQQLWDVNLGVTYLGGG
jgi:hypothetical protein